MNLITVQLKQILVLLQLKGILSCHPKVLLRPKLIRKIRLLAKHCQEKYTTIQNLLGKNMALGSRLIHLGSLYLDMKL